MLLNSCSYRTQIKNQGNWSKDCNKLIDSFHKYWHFRPKNSVYTFARNLELTLLLNEECLKGVDRSVLYKFLGEPQKETDKEARYYLSTGCFYERKDCHYLDVDFNKDQKVESCNFSRILHSPPYKIAD